MEIEEVIFMQGGDDYEEWFPILDKDGDDALLRHLLQWDTGDPGRDLAGVDPWGPHDTVVWYTLEGQPSADRLDNGLALCYNLRYGYAGLTRHRKPDADGFPRVETDGRTVWACCVSEIGPPCDHRTEPTS